jgi:hypothetical protein
MRRKWEVPLRRTTFGIAAMSPLDRRAGGLL